MKTSVNHTTFTKHLICASCYARGKHKIFIGGERGRWAKREEKKTDASLTHAEFVVYGKNKFKQFIESK